MVLVGAVIAAFLDSHKRNGVVVGGSEKTTTECHTFV
jgi:hypothetical protein